nr:MAG TPA: hypothetical protein [Caudoviricetes sp.]
MDGNYSLADIAAATGNGRNNDGMFGGDGAWWLIVLWLLQSLVSLYYLHR